MCHIPSQTIVKKVFIVEDFCKATTDRKRILKHYNITSENWRY